MIIDQNNNNNNNNGTLLLPYKKYTFFLICTLMNNCFKNILNITINIGNLNNLVLNWQVCLLQTIIQL